MAHAPKTPADLARRFAARRAEGRAETLSRDDGWRRETYRLPRREASQTAREWFDRYPRSDFLTEVESWRVLEDGSVEFTMRRRPAGD
jgi:hypothetical protein